MSIYEYLLTFYKVIAGLTTAQRLIYASLICFGIYLLWVIFALVFSFQRKFYTKSVKMYNLVKNSKNLAECTNIVDRFSSKLSIGFFNGWERFKAAKFGKPSSFISRNESLDNEVNGGLFNQGKSIMKSFIWLTTILLTLFNFAFHCGESQLTAILVAESLMLPIIYYCILKIFYYLYTIVRQQLYKLDIESYYDLINVLDAKFSEGTPAQVNYVENKPINETNNFAYEPVSEVRTDTSTFEKTSDLDNTQDSGDVQNMEEDINNEAKETKTDDAIADNELLEQTNSNEQEEISATLEDVEEDVPQLQEPLASEPESDKDLLDKYDVFKKKNIDVTELSNEVPESSQSLPYINVDSDFVIKDDNDTENNVEEKTDSSNLTDEKPTNTSGENDSNFFNTVVSENVANEEIENKENVNVVAENSVPLAETTANDNHGEENAVNNQDYAENEQKPHEHENNGQVKKEYEVESQDFEDLDNDIKLNLDDYEINKYVISQKAETKEVEPSKPSNEVADNKLDTDNANTVNEDKDLVEDYANIVGEFKSNKVKQEESVVESENVAPIARRNAAPERLIKDAQENNNVNLKPNYEGLSTEEEQVNNGDKEKLQSVNKEIAASNSNKKFDSVAKKDSVEEEKPKPKRTSNVGKRLESIKNERLKEEKMEKIATAKRRGRPKKQVFDDDVIITNDREFDEVLSRAEKLMRKSEEGLSASQSKRIEKELSMLMNAMNKYKEKK